MSADDASFVWVSRGGEGLNRESEVFSYLLSCDG